MTTAHRILEAGSASAVWRSGRLTAEGLLKGWNVVSSAMRRHGSQGVREVVDVSPRDANVRRVMAVLDDMIRTSKVPTLSNVARRAGVKRRFIAHNAALLTKLDHCHAVVVNRYYRAVDANAWFSTDVLQSELELAKAHMVRLQLELARRERRLGAGGRIGGAAPMGVASPRRRAEAKAQQTG